MDNRNHQMKWSRLRGELIGDILGHLIGIQIAFFAVWIMPGFNGPFNEFKPLLLPYVVPGLLSLCMTPLCWFAWVAARREEAGLQELRMVERMATRCRYVWFPVAGAALIADLVADPDIPLSTAMTVLAVFCAWPSRRLTKYLRSHAQPEPGA